MKKRGLFRDFVRSETTAGAILILCSVFSLVVSNTSAGEGYRHFWHLTLLGKEIEFWINDGLMTIFFLLVGLEIEREFYIGELSDLKKSMLPVIAALGGMMVPALIHFGLNFGTGTQRGFGIPMATDIAFSLAVLSLLGKRVPLSLKIFLTALAIIDDLGAIVVIALFYSKGFSITYFSIAITLFLIMLLLNRLKIYVTAVYLLIGIVMWFCMYKSGVHATITGVLLAFAMPFGKGDEHSVSFKLQHRLHLPVALLILPLFALANTAINFGAVGSNQVFSANSLGIALGLFLGKPLGIFVFVWLGICLGWCLLPGDISRSHLMWTGFLGGIGFTMSIFITHLAFSDNTLTDSSKIAIIAGSLLSGTVGYFGLRGTLRE